MICPDCGDSGIVSHIGSIDLKNCVCVKGAALTQRENKLGVILFVAMLICIITAIFLDTFLAS